MTAAVLVLENGRCFRGRGFAGAADRTGEVVFNTSMTGYQEILSDPSYAGQIVVMTAPEIGNTGVTDEDLEAARLVCAGLVVREASPVASSWRARGELGDLLDEHGLFGLEEVDTRALTRVLRDEGAMRGILSTRVGEIDALIAEVRRAPEMTGLDLVPRVTCAEPYTWDQPSWRASDQPRVVPPATLHVVAYDFGIKRNILRQLRDLGCRTTVVPARTPAREVLGLRPDGIFLSNGPGDPAAVDYAIAAVRELVAAPTPLFGICLGHQILGLALGARTFKLPFGHHGGNHPVKDLATGRVEITSQNHGFAVDPASLPAGVAVSHLNLYDGTVEGLRVSGRAIASVQYHPEASPGPHDAGHLFAGFVAAMTGARA